MDRDAGSGDYGKVYFYTTETQTSPGTVTYFYASTNFKDNGFYSVDYKHGRIYTQRAIAPTGGTYDTWEIYCDYQYTDYRAEYRIARFVDLDSYEVDMTNRTVTILDKEILKRMQIPLSTYNGHPPLYLINYDYVKETREDISDLQDKFTPVLKDYSLRILTKGRIV